MRKEKLKFIKWIILSLMIFLTIKPMICRAFFWDEFFNELETEIEKSIPTTTENQGNNSQIINKIEVEVNSGGNKIEGNGETGKIIEGETKSEVHIENIIDGKEIEPINIESKENEVKVNSEVKVEDGKVEVKREIETGSEKKTENYQTELTETEENRKSEKIKEELKDDRLTTFKNWWLDLMEGFESFLKNIFDIF